jgi:hypothetical protein
MYSYVMLCAIRDALERNIKLLHLQGAHAGDSDLNAAQVALALTRSQIGSHLADNAGKLGPPEEPLRTGGQAS